MKSLFLFALLTIGSSRHLISQFIWQHTDGPFGSALSYLYSNEDYVFAPEDDFLYRSADGIQWEKINHEAPYFMGVHGDTVIYRKYDFDLHLIQLHISPDNGETWTYKYMPSFLQNYGLNDLILSGHGLYWTQGTAKIYRSNDLGDTWDTLVNPIAGSYVNLALFDERLYVYTLTKLWRSDTNGENWEEVEMPISLFPNEKLNDLVVSGSNMLIASRNYIFNSTDNGQTWSETALYSTSTDKIGLAGDIVYANMFDGLYRTNNFGITWDKVLNRYDYPFLIHLGSLREDFLAATFDHGVYKYNELTGEMIEINEGLSKGLVYDLAPGGDKIWTATGNDVFVYDIPSNTWSEKMGLPSVRDHYENVSANDDGWVVASGWNADSFYLSVNEGQSWDTLYTGFTIHNIELLGNNIFVFSGAQLIRSLDMGLNWDTLAIDFVDRAFVPFNGKYYVMGHDALFYTADHGITWEANAVTLDFLKLYAFADKFFGVIVDNQVTDLYISDNGVDWTYAGDNFPEVYYLDFLSFGSGFFFRDEENYYALFGSDGHYSSPVDNISWTWLDPVSFANDYLLNDNVLYVGQKGMYATIIENPYITSVDDVNGHDDNFFSVSPNPARDFIDITINGPEVTGEISLSLFDSKGAFIKSHLNSNSNNIQIDIRNILPGIYFLHARTDGRDGMIKVVKN